MYVCIVINISLGLVSFVFVYFHATHSSKCLFCMHFKKAYFSFFFRHLFSTHTVVRHSGCVSILHFTPCTNPVQCTLSVHRSHSFYSIYCVIVFKLYEEENFSLSLSLNRYWNHSIHSGKINVTLKFIGICWSWNILTIHTGYK